MASEASPVEPAQVAGAEPLGGDGLPRGREARPHMPAASRMREQELSAQNERFTAAIENMSHGLCMFDGAERMIVCNRHYIDMFALSPEIVRPGVSYFNILRHSVDIGIAAMGIEELYASKKAFVARREPCTYPEQLSDGRTINISHRPMSGGGWVSIYEDITERLRNEEAIREQNRRFDAALANMSQGLVMFDADGRLIVRNQRFLELYGLDSDPVPLGATHRELAERLIGIGVYARYEAGYLLETTQACLAEGGRSPILRELADGRILSITHRPMPGGGWVATMEDVTERRRTEARIEFMAKHDALTRLPTRMVFRERLAQALAETRRDCRPLAVLSLDLDRFKAVNDSFGHPAGDALLVSAAERLRGCLREGIDMVARFGGDEFTILQTGARQPEGADGLARRLIDAVGRPHLIDGREISVGVSIGVAIAPEDGLDPDLLFRNSDLALYRAKHEGRNVYRFFEPEMDARIQARRAMELDLRDALLRGEFELHYQPVVALAHGGVIGFEALMRWRSARRGLVQPEDFIPIAEETRLIVPLGDWALRQACREAAGWPGDLRIAVNVSAVQLRNGNMAQSVLSALADSGLAPGRLELEITETVLMDESDAVMQSLRQLREIGVRIALDDFGTGYSSLSYLRKFPFDRIKIDRSFTAEITASADTAAIVRAIVGLGTQLGMSVTAEGVETQEQLDILRAEGCTEAQGFLIGQAQAAGQVLAILGLESGFMRNPASPVSAVQQFATGKDGAKTPAVEAARRKRG